RPGQRLRRRRGRGLPCAGAARSCRGRRQGLRRQRSGCVWPARVAVAAPPGASACRRAPTPPPTHRVVRARRRAVEPTRRATAKRSDLPPTVLRHGGVQCPGAVGGWPRRDGREGYEELELARAWPEPPRWRWAATVRWGGRGQLAIVAHDPGQLDEE